MQIFMLGEKCRFFEDICGMSDNPTTITYGTALSGTQLNAACATTSGTFAYNPPSGTVLSAGNQTLHVDFTPNDAANYSGTSKNVTINVLKGNPTLTLDSPADIIYETALNGTHLNASASVPGTFRYTPLSGTVMSAGNQTLNVDFTPTDTTNYNTVSKNVTINVQKATPTVTWNNPANITYETALDVTQLNATTSVPGSFIYTPVSGTVLSAGVHNLQVDFTPTDTANYSTTSKNVTINVFKSAPIITWNKPADIIYETELNDTQLDASALIPGAFTYTPASGTVLSAGNQTLHVDFTPNDAANYSGTSKNVTINVEKSTPTITWSYPTDIIYETALNSTQLNASASVTGSFVYTPASGSCIKCRKQKLCTLILLQLILQTTAIRQRTLQ